ncbi:MAG: creatininase family protein [Blastochloris sp.]|nr:creatininase family protein [Blastochloris sp.]
MSAADTYLYADLTWPEVNEAVEMGKVILLPVGSTEQHGRHLPLDVDNLLAASVCLEAGRRDPGRILVAPTIPYGFNIHAMDFPGTIHVAYDHFVEFCLDVVKSFAYHGFKRIVIVDGHGSNEHLLEFVGRRAILETDALVASFMWWNMLRVDPEFLPGLRESVFPAAPPMPARSRPRCTCTCAPKTSRWTRPRIVSPSTIRPAPAAFAGSMPSAPARFAWLNGQAATLRTALSARQPLGQPKKAPASLMKLHAICWHGWPSSRLTKATRGSAGIPRRQVVRYRRHSVHAEYSMLHFVRKAHR